MERRCAPTRFDLDTLDAEQELENAAAFARSYDPEAAWTASCRAMEAAERTDDPSLRADAELAAARFAEQERAFRESVERRMRLHEENEMRSAGAGADEQMEAMRREPGVVERMVEAIRGAFSAPRRARTSP